MIKWQIYCSSNIYVKVFEVFLAQSKRIRLVLITAADEAYKIHADIEGGTKAKKVETNGHQYRYVANN